MPDEHLGFQGQSEAMLKLINANGPQGLLAFAVLRMVRRPVYQAFGLKKMDAERCVQVKSPAAEIPCAELVISTLSKLF